MANNKKQINKLRINFTKISVIIPVLNEEKSIGEVLFNLRRQNASQEIIVVDGGSNDDTGKIAKKYSRVVNARKGRAYQMNAGAKVAKGDVLLFLHADTILPKGAMVDVGKILESGCIAGGFHKKFDADNTFLSNMLITTKLWFKLTKVIFGDQAFFIRKKDFESVGGFAKIDLMEDVEISKKLSKIGKLGLSNMVVTTSARRFLEGGIVKTFCKMMWMYTRYRMGADPNKLALEYRNVR